MAGVPGDDRSDAIACDSCDARLSTSMRYCPSCGTRRTRASGSVGDSNSQPPPRSDGNDSRDGNDGSGSRSARSGDRYQSRTEPNSHARHESESESRHRPDQTAQAPDESDRQLLERRIATELERGWKLEQDFGDHAVLVKRSVGSLGAHLLIALFTIWSTMGAGNAIYAGYKYVTDVERTVVRPERVLRPEPQRWPDRRTDSDWRSTTDPKSEPRSSPGSTANRTDATNRSSVARIFAVGLCWLFALALVLEGSLLVSGFGVVLFVTGAAMIPSMRRRIRERDTITTNGRTRSITEERVQTPERPCVVCHRSFETGIERTYRERFRLLGVSLVTTESGTNYYCPDCAGLEAATRDRNDTDGTATRPKAGAKSTARSAPEPEDQPEPSVPSLDADTESESAR